jgi:hypothetical protein
MPGGAPGNTNPRTGNQHLGLVKMDWLIYNNNTLAVTDGACVRYSGLAHFDTLIWPTRQLIFCLIR